MKTIKKPNISKHLLWEYDDKNFNFKKSYRIVIERVIERGNLTDWKEMLNFYGKEKILETTQWSCQLSKRDKNFVPIFLDSKLLNAVS